MKRAVVVCAVVFAIFAGCGGGDDDAGPIAEPTATSDASPAVSPCVLDGASTDDRDRPGEQPFSPVSDLRYSESAGCPRVVFEFRDHVPGYDIGYDEPPFEECGSGEAVDVDEWDASAYLVVRLEPSGTGDPDTGQPVYDGPRDIAVDGTILKHIRRICDFEAVNEWVIGLDDERAFDVSTFDDPSRLVIDVAQG